MFTGISVGLSVGCMVFALIMSEGRYADRLFSTETAVIQNGYDYLKGLPLPETLVTAVLFSMIGYFNGNNKTVWVMTQGLIELFWSACRWPTS